MEMKLYVLSIESYSAFLETSGLLGNRIASGIIAFTGVSKELSLKEAEEKGLIKDNELTKEGKTIADIICLPEKTIVASNSTFGPVPLCIFNYKKGLWCLIKLDYINKYS